MREQPGRERILGALVELLQDHDVDDIPVKLLISRAGVHKATYYNHFRRIDDVVAALMEQFFDAYRTSISRLDDANSAANAISFVWENQGAFRALLNSNRGDEFRRRWIRMMVEEYERYDLAFYARDGQPCGFTEAEVSYHLRGLAGATMSFLERWCETGFQETPGQVVGLMMRCMNLSTEHAEARPKRGER